MEAWSRALLTWGLRTLGLLKGSKCERETCGAATQVSGVLTSPLDKAMGDNGSEHIQVLAPWGSCAGR